MTSPFRPDCFFCRGMLKHSTKDHNHALGRFDGVLMRIDGQWYARSVTDMDRELARTTPDVRLAVERPKGKRR